MHINNLLMYIDILMHIIVLVTIDDIMLLLPRQTYEL